MQPSVKLEGATQLNAIIIGQDNRWVFFQGDLIMHIRDRRNIMYFMSPKGILVSLAKYMINDSRAHEGL